MLQLLLVKDGVVRDLSANIIPKIAQADWPNDWPGFLDELASVIDHSGDVEEIISVLKVLRGTSPIPPSIPSRCCGHRGTPLW
jgi:hypothetical protein